MNKRRLGVRRWLSLPKVARLLQLSGEVVRSLIESGELPARQEGSHWLVALDEIDRFKIRRARGRK